MTAKLKNKPSGFGKASALRITKKGYAILAAIDVGTYKTISTLEAIRLAGKRGRRTINKNRRANG